jgi:tetratricopeptide (TPR) repeat protein
MPNPALPVDYWLRVSLYRFYLSALFLVSSFASLSCIAQQPFDGSSSAEKPAVVSPARVSDEITAAEAAIAKSDWKTAGAGLDAWLVSHPNDGRALFDAGYVADAQNRLDDAAGLYRRATAADPQSLEAHLSLGLLLARQDKPDEARLELVTATTLDPGEAGLQLKARAWRALARIDRDSDPSRSSADLLEALKLSPETSEDTLLAASLAEKTGQLDAAEKEYRRVLAEDPKSLAADAGLAHILIARKEFPEAETLLRGALVQAPNDPVLTAQLATVLANQDNAEALPLLQKLHAEHPADPAISRMLASVLAAAGDYAGSDQLDLQLLRAEPDDLELLISHGQNLVHQGELAQAYTVFDKASKIDSASVEAWNGLAFTASRTNRPDAAIHALTMRSEYASESASTLFLWATAYDSLHQKQQAVAYYRRFLDASAGKFPDQEWQARQRLQVLGK